MIPLPGWDSAELLLSWPSRLGERRVTTAAPVWFDPELLLAFLLAELECKVGSRLLVGWAKPRLVWLKTCDSCRTSPSGSKLDCVRFSLSMISSFDFLAKGIFWSNLFAKNLSKSARIFCALFVFGAEPPPLVDLILAAVGVFAFIEMEACGTFPTFLLSKMVLFLVGMLRELDYWLSSPMNWS